MDTATLHALEIAGYYALAILLATLIGMMIVTFLVHRLLHRYFPDALHEQKRNELSAIVGTLERVLYIVAILMSKPELIAAWIVLKAVGEWGDIRQDGGIKRPGVASEYMLNLIGSLLSLFVGVGFGYLIEALLPPLTPIAPLPLPVSH